ncbi:MAG: class I SAM-dependent methyltransferase [Planctomycetota bacterium]|jgi:2-polyprenyl-3-methyl-5-hydroxy-6-metoxy-1,4-benzoquinol methylase
MQQLQTNSSEDIKSKATTSVQVSEDQQIYDMDWDGYSLEIAKRKESDEWAVLREARESHYEELFTIKPGDKVLDAGCGHGEYCVYGLEHGARVWAFDYSEEMVQYTRQILAMTDLEAETVEEGSVLEIPYADNTFDAVICLSVLDHIADREKGFRELARVLKPGGHMYIDVPNKYAYHWRACFGVMRMLGMYPAGKIHFFKPRELERMVRDAGCHVEARLGLTFSPPFSGLYTTDLRRRTFLPDWLIGPLDRMYLATEKLARRHAPLRHLCWHNFVRAVKR